MDNIQPGIASFYGAYENSTLVEVRVTKSEHQQSLLNTAYASVSAGPLPNTVNPTLVADVRGNPLKPWYGYSCGADNTRMDGRTGVSVVVGHKTMSNQDTKNSTHTR